MRVVLECVRKSVIIYDVEIPDAVVRWLHGKELSEAVEKWMDENKWPGADEVVENERRITSIGTFGRE